MVSGVDESKRLEKAHAQTADVYQRQAAGWDAHRPKILIERSWLERFCALLPSGGSVLELGCGAGEPIAGYFLEHGYRYTGLDYAQAMLDIAERRYPSATWLHGDMRALPQDTVYDGVLSWDGSFHLSGPEQASLIGALTKIIRPGGPLLLTIGDWDGEVLGMVEGEDVYHASLSKEAYETCLTQAGFEGAQFIFEDPACDYHSIMLARRLGDGSKTAR